MISTKDISEVINRWKSSKTAWETEISEDCCWATKRRAKRTLDDHIVVIEEMERLVDPSALCNVHRNVHDEAERRRDATPELPPQIENTRGLRPLRRELPQRKPTEVGGVHDTQSDLFVC